MTLARPRFDWITESWNQPAELTGGDFVLRRQAGRRLRIILGDACGHGRAAAPIAAAARRLMAADLDGPLDARVLRRWNAALYAQLPCGFVCVTCVELDLATGRGWVINAGNPPVLIRRGDGAIRGLATQGTPFGATEDDAWTPARRQPIRLKPQDMLLCFTDGLTERVGPSRRFFGLNRVMRAASVSFSVSPVRTLRRWVAHFEHGEAGQDDLLVICVRSVEAATAA